MSEAASPGSWEELQGPGAQDSLLRTPDSCTRFWWTAELTRTLREPPPHTRRQGLWATHTLSRLGADCSVGGFGQDSGHFQNSKARCGLGTRVRGEAASVAMTTAGTCLPGLVPPSVALTAKVGEESRPAVGLTGTPRVRSREAGTIASGRIFSSLGVFARCGFQVGL